MITALEYALMAGSAYISNRPGVNLIPVPTGWTKKINPDSYFKNPDSGFEAISYTNGTDLVISYAGTDFTAVGVALTDFVYGNIPLASGVSINGADQLIDAVEYYLQVKAANPNAHIVITGHSLGGALAALVGVFFGVEAHSFDQVPAYATATTGPANLLRDALMARNPGRTDLTALDNYIAAMDATNPSPNSADTYEARAANITNINVHGEVAGLIPAPRIGNSTDIWQQNNLVPILGKIDLHSIALLSTFLQSGDLSAATEPAATLRPHTLGQVSYQLPDLLKMIFDPKLYAFQIDDSQHENFLERLVKHEAGVQPDPETGSAAIPADAMVTRLTSDLWRIAQDGGLTMTDWALTGTGVPNNVSQALIAFAMQKYYEETNQSAGYNQELFTDLGTGGIRFDITDISTRLLDEWNSTGTMQLDKMTEGKYDLKGYQYFETFLSQIAPDLGAGARQFTTTEQGIIKSLLPVLRDWYVQAGAAGMNATDTLNRGAFMLGGNGADALVGGTGADLLVGNAGADLLQGGKGNDFLLGGAGVDAYVYTKGTNNTDGLDTILDSGGDGKIFVDGAQLTGGDQYGDTNVHKDADGHLYVDVGHGNMVIDGNLLILDQQAGELGLTNMTGPVADIDPVTVDPIIYGDRGAMDFYDANGNTYHKTDTLDNLITDPGKPEPDRADTLYDSAANDHIIGGGGDDRIDAYRGGDDLIEAGAGRDHVHGGAGKDVISGGADGDILTGGDNNDRIYADSEISAADAISQGNTVNLNGSSGTGLQGDWLAGGAGDDTLIAGADNDVLSGGGGSDLLIAGAGDDDIMGDTDWAATSFDWTVTDQPGGSRYFYPVDSTAQPAEGKADVIYAGAGADHVWGEFGNDVIFGEGDDDKLYGGQDNDIILGGTGKDTLYGDGDGSLSGGSDYLDGGEQDDTLYGGGGDDIIIGGKGTDTLDGGTGRDTYIYNKGDGKDHIAETTGGNTLRFGAGIGSSDITLRLGSLMLDLGNGDEIHIDNFNPNDAGNGASISGFEFADGSTRWRIRAANDANHAMQIEWRIAA